MTDEQGEILINCAERGTGLKNPVYTLSGYVLLPRWFLRWQWYDDVSVTRVFLHLLMTANFERRYWHGNSIARGQRITTVRGIADETGLSVSTVTKALSKLVLSGDIKKESSPRFTLITITNYDEYQRSEYGKNERKKKESDKAERVNGERVSSSKPPDVDFFEDY